MTIGTARREMAEFLQRRGVHAVGAWDSQARRRHSKPVAAVSLQEVESRSAGFQHYLGERYDPQQAAKVAVYGKQVRLVFALTLYSPRQEPDGCLALFDQLAEVLAAEGPEGLNPGTLRCGQVSYDRESELLYCPCSLECTGWVYPAPKAEGPELTEVTVKGELT